MRDSASLGPSHGLRRQFDLPNFVSIGNRATTIGAGFLGMNFAPFVVGNATQPPTNLALPQRVNDKRFSKRMDPTRWLGSGQVR